MRVYEKSQQRHSVLLLQKTDPTHLNKDPGPLSYIHRLVEHKPGSNRLRYEIELKVGSLFANKIFEGSEGEGVKKRKQKMR